MPADAVPESLRAIVFDFDGTLADSYAAIDASVNHVRAHHGLPPLPVAEVKRHVGRGPHYLFQHTIGGTSVEADLVLYRAHHPSIMRPLTHLLPGADKALRAARPPGPAAARPGGTGRLPSGLEPIRIAVAAAFRLRLRGDPTR